MIDTHLPSFFKQKIYSKGVEKYIEPLQKVEEQAAKTLLILSANKQNIEAQNSLLQNMLDACKLSSEDYEILALQPKGETMVWYKMKQQFQPKFVLCLGDVCKIIGLQVSFPSHRISIFNETTWMITGTLEQLAINEEMRRHLWTKMLKPVFIDKAI